MIDFDDMFSLGFENDSVEPDPHDVMEESQSSAGWGSFLLGGALGAVWAGASKKRFNNLSIQPEVFGSFSNDEKVFLRQIWKFEEEFDKALKEDNSERLVLLLNGLVGCINGPWKTHLPGNNEYSATEKFDAEFDYLALPILNKALAISESKILDRLTPEQFDRIDGKQMNFNPDKWVFRIK